MGYVASHDLQEPLRKIAACSSFLDEAIVCANQADIVHASTVIRTAALHARELVDDLLTFSRAINSDLQLQILDLRAIEFALTNLSELVSETNASINVEMPSVTIDADRLQFVRLIQNIVSNAIKYSKPDRRPRIKITAVPVNDSAVRLAIADDGIGSEQKFARAIFEPFKRLHNKSDFPGTGIGLAICKSIADRHEWRILARSQPGEGATFIIILPTTGDS